MNVPTTRRHKGLTPDARLLHVDDGEELRPFLVRNEARHIALFVLATTHVDADDGARVESLEFSDELFDGHSRSSDVIARFKPLA